MRRCGQTWRRGSCCRWPGGNCRTWSGSRPRRAAAWWCGRTRSDGSRRSRAMYPGRRCSRDRPRRWSAHAGRPAGMRRCDQTWRRGSCCRWPGGNCRTWSGSRPRRAAAWWCGRTRSDGSRRSRGLCRDTRCSCGRRRRSGMRADPAGETTPDGQRSPGRMIDRSRDDRSRTRWGIRSPRGSVHGRIGSPAGGSLRRHCPRF